MRPRVLVDTAPLAALLLPADQYHDLCIQQMTQIDGPLLTCWPVVTEAVWLLRRYPTGIRKLFTSFGGNPLTLLPLDESDLPEIDSILHKYEGSGVQLADAAIVHLANREGIDTVFTLDRRDFSILRLKNGKRIRILPGVP